MLSSVQGIAGWTTHFNPLFLIAFSSTFKETGNGVGFRNFVQFSNNSKLQNTIQKFIYLAALRLKIVGNHCKLMWQSFLVT